MKNAFDQAQLGLTIVRLTLGTIFIAHGGQKVLGIFGGQGLTAFVKWGASLGLSPAIAYLAAFAEFLGGILLFTGIAAEVGALMTIAVMLGAVFLVHWSHGYFSQDGGFEYPLNLILFALAIIVGGPGAFTLWNPFKSYRQEYSRQP